MQFWLGLGGNLGDPLRQIEAAIDSLEEHSDIEVLQRSSCYRTPPWGDTRQDAFINAVVLIETTVEPLELLRLVQDIEHRLGRTRSDRRWGPRSMDIDLLLCDGRTMNTTELILPHPRMHQRAFVLVPMAEIDSSVVIPGHGPVADALARIDCDGVVKLTGQIDDDCGK